MKLFKTLQSLLLNPFLVSVSILYPLETPENQKFSDVFRRYKKGTLGRNGLNHFPSK